MMDFVFCTGKDYLKGYGVLMLSILRFAPPVTERLRFHILSDDLDDADKRLLEGIVARRENTEVCFYSPSKALSESALASINAATLGANTRLTPATYWRLLIADLLPPDIHSALYLDGDIVCAGSLDELFSLDLKGCPIAACTTCAAARISICNRLDYPPADGYFNTGVVLFDLDIWRKESLSKTLLDWLCANSKKCSMHDQDVINACLHGRILPLDFSYNVRSVCFYVFYWLEQEKNNYYASRTQFLPKSEWPALRAAVESPRLVHTPGPVKMWHRDCDNPYAPVWRYFYAQSPWAAEPLKRCKQQLSAKARIKRQGRRALERLNLISPATFPCPEEAFASAQRILDRLREEDRV